MLKWFSGLSATSVYKIYVSKHHMFCYILGETGKMFIKINHWLHLFSELRSLKFFGMFYMKAECVRIILIYGMLCKSESVGYSGMLKIRENNPLFPRWQTPSVFWPESSIGIPNWLKPLGNDIIWGVLKLWGCYERPTVKAMVTV